MQEAEITVCNINKQNLQLKNRVKKLVKLKDSNINLKFPLPEKHY